MAANSLILAAAFLLGSIPSGYALVRLRTGADIRERGSGNIGATNVLRTAGQGLGLLTLLADVAKGWVALRLAREFAPVTFPAHDEFLAAALLLVVLGHLYTPWLRFQGGKGVATALGAFLALAPLAILATAAVFAITLGLSRFVSLASIAASLALPPLVALLYGRSFAPPLYAAIAAVAALVIWRHRKNIGRLRRGTEPRLGAKAGSAV